MSPDIMSSEVVGIADIIRQCFSKTNSQLLAQAYFDGGIADNGSNATSLAMLTKNGLIRPCENDDVYILAINLKSILNKLLLRHASYRKRTDIAKVMLHIDDDIQSYKRALRQGQHNEVAFYLSQIDEELYGIIYELEDSVSGLFAAITSKFGFVETLESKIRENQKAIAYTEGLLNALADINLTEVYGWLDWHDVPVELSRKVMFFIDGYRRINKQLESVVHRMRQLLMILRQQNQQVARLRTMAKFLTDDALWEFDDYTLQSAIPDIFNRVSPLQLSSSIDIQNPIQQQELTQLYQSLRKETTPHAVANDLRQQGRIDNMAQRARQLDIDYVLTQCEWLFKQVLINQNTRFSALDFLQDDSQLVTMLPKHLWLSILYNEYHKCSFAVRQAINIDFKTLVRSSFSSQTLVLGNLLVSDIYLQRQARLT